MSHKKIATEAAKNKEIQGTNFVDINKISKCWDCGIK